MTAQVLWQVAAQGNFITKLGRRCFALGEATAMAADLRTRGYADAHVQRWCPERPLPPLTFTLFAPRPS